MSDDRPIVKFILGMNKKERLAFIIGHMMSSKASDDLINRMLGAND